MRRFTLISTHYMFSYSHFIDTLNLFYFLVNLKFINNNNNNSNNNNNNNNNDFPRGLEIVGRHPAGYSQSYGQMKCSLALVGNYLEMVSR